MEHLCTSVVHQQQLFREFLFFHRTWFFSNCTVWIKMHSNRFFSIYEIEYHVSKRLFFALKIEIVSIYFVQIFFPVFFGKKAEERERGREKKMRINNNNFALSNIMLTSSFLFSIFYCRSVCVVGNTRVIYSRITERGLIVKMQRERGKKTKR